MDMGADMFRTPEVTEKKNKTEERRNKPAKNISTFFWHEGGSALRGILYRVNIKLRPFST